MFPTHSHGAIRATGSALVKSPTRSSTFERSPHKSVTLEGQENNFAGCKDLNPVRESCSLATLPAGSYQGTSLMLREVAGGHP